MGVTISPPRITISTAWFWFHSLEQPVKSQHDEDHDGPGEEVGDDAETEERLVRGDVVGRRARVPTHEQGAGNIDEAERRDDCQ
jgi:hypothetical protein